MFTVNETCGNDDEVQREPENDEICRKNSVLVKLFIVVIHKVKEVINCERINDEENGNGQNEFRSVEPKNKQKRVEFDRRGRFSPASSIHNLKIRLDSD